MGAELARDEALPVNISVVWYTAIASKLSSHKSLHPTGGCHRGSVGVARHLGAAAADQEVEVAALVRLQHVLDVQLAIATHQQFLRWHEVGQARGEFGVRDVQVQAAAGACLLYTSPSPRDRTRSRMPSSA